MSTIYSPRSPRLRVSQRPPTACRECSIRKVRCDKKTPCGRCVKKSLQCTREVVRLTKALSHSRDELQFLRRLRDVTVASEGQGGQVVKDEIDARIRLLNHGRDEDGEDRGKRDVGMGEDCVITEATASLGVVTSLNKLPLLQSSAATTATDNSASVVTALEFLTWGRHTQACYPHRRCDCYQKRHYSELVSINSDPAWVNRIAIGVNDLHSRGSTVTPSLMSSNSFVNTTIDSSIFLPPTVAAKVIQFHMDYLHWHHNAFHGPTFLACCRQFWATGKVDHKLWLALYLATCSVSLWSLLNADHHRVKLGLDDLLLLDGNLVERQFQAMVDVLYGENFLENLSLYSIQAIVISTRIAHNIDRSELNATLIGAAVRIAHCMGLHKIVEPAPAGGDGDNDDRINNSNSSNDVGWHERVELETGKRVWAQLLIHDHFQIPFTDSYIIHPQHYITPLPENCNDSDMIPQPPDVATNSSYTRMIAHTATFMPSLLDGLGPMSARKSLTDVYSHILACDRAMRRDISRIPGFLLRNTPADTPTTTATATPYPDPLWIPLARCTLAISAAEKIIMIHRPVLLASFQLPSSSEFRHTRNTCVAAAKTILREHNHVIHANIVPIWTHSAFCITGAIVLGLELLHQPDHTDDTAHTYRQILVRAGDRLRTRRCDAIARRGALLIDTLLAAEEDLVVRLMRTVRHPTGSASTAATAEEHQCAIIHDMIASHEILARFLVHESTRHAKAPAMDVIVPSAFVDISGISASVRPESLVSSASLNLVQDFDIWFNDVFASENDSAMLSMGHRAG